MWRLCFVGIASLVVGGCFNPSVRECAVTCSASNPCPSGASCLLDGFCHESATESLCTDSPDDAGPTDGSPDAALACGNGIVEMVMGEACDDGNGTDGDGCSSGCAEEAGFVCVEQPSVCRRNPSVAGELVITEAMVNPTGPDGGKEWFEIHNPTAEDFDLKGMLVSEDGGVGESFTVTMSLPIEAGAHVVLATSADMLTNGGLAADLAYGAAFLLANGGDEIELRFGGVLIDRIDITASQGQTQSTAVSLSRTTYDAISNDISANFCPAVDPYGDGDLGTPGAFNPPCP